MFIRHNFSRAGCAGYYVKSGEVNSLQIDAYTVNCKTGSKISNILGSQIVEDKFLFYGNLHIKYFQYLPS